MRKIRDLLVVSMLVAVLVSNAFSDSRPYNGELRISDEGEEVRVIHDHTRKAGRAWYESRVKSFNECDHTARTQGVLQAFRASERLFCTAVPALTHIWLSPDEQFIVGLSDIKHANHYQAVVYSISGELLFRRSVRCGDSDIKGCRESVTNWVSWFHDKHPGIVLRGEDKGKLELSLNSPVKSRIRFVFPLKPESPLDQTPCGRNRQELSGESFWFAYAFGMAWIESEHDDAICLSLNFPHYTEYSYVMKESLADRKVKEEMYREVLDMAVACISDEHMTREGFEQLRLWLKRITGKTFDTKEELVPWVRKYHEAWPCPKTENTWL